MKNIVKFSYLTLVSLIAMAFGACTNDYDYSAANVPENQVYFSNALASTIDIDKNAGGFDLVINRVDDKGELTVPLTFEPAEGNIFSVPSSVSFVNGQKTSSIHITYNADDVEYGTYTGGTIKVGGDAIDTTYGLSSFTFKAGATEWRTMSGKAVYREAIISSLFSLPVLTYDVDIQESLVTPGRYRLVSPYGKGLDIDNNSITEFYKNFIDAGVFGWDETVNTDIVIDATDPNFVYVEEFYTGVNDETYGTVHVVNGVVSNLAAGVALDVIKQAKPEWFGKLVNGVITFPAGSQYVNFNTSLEGEYYGDSNGMFAIALPGHEITDFGAVFEYRGRFTNTKDVDYAQGYITLGDDVARAKYAVAADGDDIQAIVDGIVDGSVESVEITESGNVQFVLEETGTYNVIIVTYDSSNEARGAYYSTFNFRSSKDGSSEEETEWKAIFTGDFMYNYEPNFLQDNKGNFVGSWFDKQTVSDVTLYVDANDDSHYMVAPFGNNMKEGDGLIFKMDETGGITYRDVDTGTQAGDYGEVYVGDFCTVTGQDNGGEPSSFYTNDNMFLFANVYYVEAGYIAGAYELFVPKSKVNIAPYNANVVAAQNRVKMAMTNKMFQPSMNLNFKGAKKNLQSKPLARMKAKKVTTPMTILK